jgi:hypothetical protein
MTRDGTMDLLSSVEVEFDEPGPLTPLRPVSPARVEPADPAALVARSLLRSVMSDPAVNAAVSAPGAVIVVQVSDPSWVDPVLEQWNLIVCPDVEPLNGDVESRRSARKWLVFSRNGTEKGIDRTRGNEAVQDALWHGVAVTGISQSPDRLLPSDLIAAADCRIVIPPVTPSAVRFLVRALTRRICVGPVTPEFAASLTPAILRLARRPHQTGREYLARMAAIASKLKDELRPGPRLEDLEGMPGAKDWGLRLLRDLADFRRGLIKWSDMDRGLLLYGQPGTGKSLFAESLARSAGLPLIATSFSAWQSSRTGHLGDCLSAMRGVFDEARRLAPSILFIDELDAIGSRTGADKDHRDYWTSVVTSFLELLDGPNDRRNGVIVLGATNNVTVLDPAIVRAGRFDRIIEVPMPDRSSLAGILRHHLGTDLVSDDLEAASRLAEGSSGADCARAVRGARQVARHLGRPMVLADLLRQLRAGPPRSPDAELRVSIHEAGHAVASALLRPGKLIGVNVVKRGNRGGQAAAVAADLSTESGIHDEIMELLAGRAAEEVVLGSVSGGSGGSDSSDLARATQLALAEETAFGLGGGGLVWMGQPDAKTVSTLLLGSPEVAGRVRIRLDGIYAEILALLNLHHTAVRVVAAELLLKVSLTGPEVEALVGRHRTPVP